MNPRVRVEGRGHVYTAAITSAGNRVDVYIDGAWAGQWIWREGEIATPMEQGKGRVERWVLIALSEKLSRASAAGVRS